MWMAETFQARWGCSLFKGIIQYSLKGLEQKQEKHQKRTSMLQWRLKVIPNGVDDLIFQSHCTTVLVH
jgi:hypothetical protein